MTGLLRWLNENSGTVTAMAAVAGVLVAAVYAFFTILLWRATKAQAEITRRIFEASQRPWVSFRVDTRDHGSGQDQRTGTVLRFHIGAHGGMPAIVTGWEVRVSHEGRELGQQTQPEGEVSLGVFPGKEEMGKPIPLQVEKFYARRDSEAPLLVEATILFHGLPGRRYKLRSAIHVSARDMFSIRHEFEERRP